MFIRYEIGSTGWAIFFLEKCSVRLPSFWISRPLQNECRFCFLCIRFSTLRQVGFTSICRSGDFCCFVCIYNIFKYDRSDSIIHQIRLVYILIKCIIDAGSQIIFRVSDDLLRQLFLFLFLGLKNFRNSQKYKQCSNYTYGKRNIRVFNQLKAQGQTQEHDARVSKQ